jgi:curved DNA-binding protein CbpA
MKTLYETLEVSPRARSLVIRAAYRCLAQIYHPDKNQNSDEAREQMMAINHAYAVLSDPVKRREYDLSLGTTKDLRERRGLGSNFPAQRKAAGSGSSAARPFAFRPLG